MLPEGSARPWLTRQRMLTSHLCRLAILFTVSFALDVMSSLLEVEGLSIGETESLSEPELSLSSPS